MDAKAYEEIIDFIAGCTTPESVIASPIRDAPTPSRGIVATLQRGNDHAEDRSELDECIHLEHIMVMAKARARLKAQLG